MLTGLIAHQLFFNQRNLPEVVVAVFDKTFDIPAISAILRIYEGTIQLPFRHLFDRLGKSCRTGKQGIFEVGPVFFTV